MAKLRKPKKYRPCPGGCLLWDCARPIRHQGPCQPKPMKAEPQMTWGLIIGRLYDEGWERQAQPITISWECTHCKKLSGEEWKLHKKFYWPFVFWKIRTFYVCLTCGNEEEVVADSVSAPQPHRQDKTTLQRFKALSKEQQDEILKHLPK